jgi:hypothetical protein
MYYPADTAGLRIMIGRFFGAPRFMHLSINRGTFDPAGTGLTAYETAGQTSGHSAAADALSVAATPAHSSFAPGQPDGPYPGAFSGTNVSETFTSDGPRRMFFAPDGTPYTPGNFLSTGGIVRNKPDITAADGVATTVAGFQPFFGTSAAAPNAGAIAALLLDARPGASAAQVRYALTATAIDIEATGWDRNTGAGIVDAFTAGYALINDPAAVVTFESAANSATEADGTKYLTVARTGNTSRATSVDYAVTGGTATPGSDFWPPAGSVSFDVGETSGSVPVTIFQNTVWEPAETVVISLRNPSAGSTVGTPATTTLTITDDESGPPADTVLGWGQDILGQSSIPVTAHSGVTAIAGGGYFSLALKDDGSVIGWGDDRSGQVTIPADAKSEVSAIAAGGSHSVALKNGGVIAWGDNFFGQASVPLDAQSGVSAISAAGYDSLALKNGGVLQWGQHDTVPVSVQSGVIAIAAGQTHSLALKADGSVVDWSVLGEDTVPMEAQSGVTAIAAGYDHSLALKSDGSVIGWGTDDFGQASIPPAAQSGVVAISAGVGFSLALKSDGSVIGWGTNYWGQLATPSAAQSGVAAISAGERHALALGIPAVGDFASATNPTVESAGIASLTVTRTGNTAMATTVDYARTGGTATPGTDFTLDPGTLSFAPGQASVTVTVTIAEDVFDEPDETVVVELTNPSPGTVLGGTASTTLTIADNDEPAVVAFATSSATVVESAGTVPLTVFRTGNTSVAASVNYAVTGGTATVGDDFTINEGTLTFGVGSGVRTIPLTIVDDAAVEPDETLVVTLSEPGVSTELGSPATMTVTITDNEPAIVAFESPTTSAAESAGTVPLTVTRGGKTTTAASVDYTVTGGTATSGDDFTLDAGTVSFAADDEEKTIAVGVVNDPLHEPDETIEITLSNPGTGTTLGSPASTTLTILNDDGQALISFGSAGSSTDEGAGGASITVMRSGNTAAAASMDYTVTGGTATSGVDFTLDAGTVSFAAGDDEETIAVGVVEDALGEPNETVEITLSNPGAGSALGTVTTHTLTIVDNEPAIVAFAAASRSVPENAGTVWLTVTRGGNTAIAASVHYARIRGTATIGSDFTLAGGTLDFSAGQTRRTIPLRISNDSAREGPETIVVMLSEPGFGTALNMPKTMTVTIKASDQRPDGLISTASSSRYVGNNVYNTTGTNQTRTQSARRSQYRDFYVRVYNDGNVPNTFTLKGSAAVSRSTVRYCYGAANITAAMRSAAGYTVSLKAGGYRQIRVRITVGSAAALGSLKTAKVTAAWSGDGTRTDVVKAVVKVVR